MTGILNIHVQFRPNTADFCQSICQDLPMCWLQSASHIFSLIPHNTDEQHSPLYADIIQVW